MRQQPFELPGYRLIAQIHEGIHTHAYRAIRLSDGLAVVLKVPARDSTSVSVLERYRHEYELIRGMTGEGVIRAHALETADRSPRLVLEDVGGESLDRLLPVRQRAGTEELSLSRFFSTADRLAAGVASIHEQGIIHKAIAPSNIVCTADARTVKIIDFAAATTLAREFPLPDVLRARALAYSSPEQTGRMNRSVDYRSDLYSLGVTYYEMLTGRLPFQSDDPLELVHSHLARTPDAPHRVNGSIPPVLSAIVMRLLAKAPEDRYQSIAGLRHDLAQCVGRLEADGRIADFDLGRRDRADRFLVPEKLYGRAAEVAALQAAFESAAAGSTAFVAVTGSSGIGKTMVVNTLEPSVVRLRGALARGKFEEMERSVPFSAFVRALRDLTQQLLKEDVERRRALVSRITAALGNNGGLIADLVPELERIIGPQPPAAPLSGIAARDRFRLLLQKFISAFASADRPLALFLDDAQWADLASLDLIRTILCESGIRHFLLICAYRDSDVTPAHPLSATLNAIPAGQTSRIALAPLPPTEVTRLVADSLGCSEERAIPLATLVHRRTRGNPFFSAQFLKTLHDEGIVAFNPETGFWECDMARVSSIALTEDVVEFMARQVRKLPGATQAALTLCACIGSSFDLETLATVRQDTSASTARTLRPALQAGLVLPQADVYRLARRDPAAAGGPADPPIPAYRFCHDRVQQAAYSLIPDAQKSAAHLRIGRLLLDRYPRAAREGKVFEITRHLNQGVGLVATDAERIVLAELNLEAGRRAKAATAYRAAGDYLAMGRSLLPDSGWRDHYELALELHNESVETTYLNGDFTEMERLAGTVIREARTLLDRVATHDVQIVARATQNRLVEAVDFGLQVLESMGTAFPRAPRPEDVAATIEETKAAYAGRSIEGLVDLPRMTDPLQRATMRILVSISAAAFLSSPQQLYPFIIARQVRLSIQHGNAAESAFSYASYGLVLSGGDIDSAYRFGQLAMALLRRVNAREWQCNVPGIVCTFIAHWKTHVRETLAPLLSAYYAGLENGDFQFAGYAAFIHSACEYFPGIEATLQELLSEITAFSESMIRIKQATMFRYYQMLHQAVHDLMEGRSSVQLLQGEYYNEQVMMPLHLETNDRNGIFYLHFNKLLLSYLFGEYRQALKDTTLAAECLDGATGFPYLPIYCMYDSLIRMAAYRGALSADAEGLWRTVDANQARLTGWLRDAPMNCRHKLHLVEAERLRTRGKRRDALAVYDKAIAEAREDGYLREEALAHELAAECRRELAEHAAADEHLRSAYSGYLRWGAAAKAAQLSRRYPQLAEAGFEPTAAASGELPASPAEPPWPGERMGTMLDLAAVLRASQSIAREIELPRVLNRLMRIALENAGAQRGALIMERDGRWLIEAQGDAEHADVRVMQSLEVRSAGTISAAIVDKVVRTREGVVLNDAAGAGEFAADDYVARNGIRSVICIPLVNQGRFSGVLYLENNLVRNAFTEGRLEVLRLLSSQMALSLDNAGLFQKEQESERRFRTIFDSVNDAIFVHEAESGRILDVNRTACVLYGYTREEMLRRSVGDLSSGDPEYSEENARRRLQQAVADVPQVFEWRARGREGRLFWVEVSAKRATIDGQVRLLVVVRDISERKLADERISALNAELERRVKERTAQLQSANSDLESFSYSVSHDLRAPLRAIDGYSRILAEEIGASMGGEAKRIFAEIRENTLAMGRLIDDLLAFSRLGRVDMKCSLIEMTPLVKSVFEELVPPSGRARTHLSLAELPPARGDERMIRQVWTNLVANALKFTSRREQASIEIGGAPGSGEVTYFIRDNGAGFDQRYAAKLFGVFQRLHSDQEFEGTGVGLAIVKRVVERHGGTVRAEGKVDQGAVFFFSLPS